MAHRPARMTTWPLPKSDFEPTVALNTASALARTGALASTSASPAATLAATAATNPLVRAPVQLGGYVTTLAEYQTSLAGMAEGAFQGMKNAGTLHAPSSKTRDAGLAVTALLTQHAATGHTPHAALKTWIQQPPTNPY